MVDYSGRAPSFLPSSSEPCCCSCHLLTTAHRFGLKIRLWQSLRLKGGAHCTHCGSGLGAAAVFRRLQSEIGEFWCCSHRILLLPSCKSSPQSKLATDIAHWATPSYM